MSIGPILDLYRTCMARALYDSMSDDLIGKYVPTERHFLGAMCGHWGHAIDVLEKQSGERWPHLRSAWDQVHDESVPGMVIGTLGSKVTPLLIAETVSGTVASGSVQGRHDGAGWSIARLNQLLDVVAGQPEPMSGTLFVAEGRPETRTHEQPGTAVCRGEVPSAGYWENLLRPDDVDQGRWVLSSIVAWTTPLSNYREEHKPGVERIRQWLSMPDERVGILAVRRTFQHRWGGAEADEKNVMVAELVANALEIAAAQGVQWTPLLEEIMRAEWAVVRNGTIVSDRLYVHRDAAVGRITNTDVVLAVASVLNAEGVVRLNDRWLAGIIRSNATCGPELVSRALASGQGRAGRGPVDDSAIEAASANPAVSDEMLLDMLYLLLRNTTPGTAHVVFARLGLGRAANRITSLASEPRLEGEVERLAVGINASELKAIIALPGAEGSEELRKRLRTLRSAKKMLDLAQGARPALFATILERAIAVSPDALQDSIVGSIARSATSAQKAAVSLETWRMLLSHASSEVRLFAQMAFTEAYQAKTRVASEPASRAEEAPAKGRVRAV